MIAYVSNIVMELILKAVSILTYDHYFYMYSLEGTNGSTQ